MNRVSSHLNFFRFKWQTDLLFGLKGRWLAGISGGVDESGAVKFVLRAVVLDPDLMQEKITRRTNTDKKIGYPPLPVLTPAC